MCYTLAYWWWVTKEANSSALAVLGFSRVSRLAVTAGSFVVAVVIFQAIGGGAELTDEMRWVVATVVAAVIFYFPVLLVNFVATPARLSKSGAKKIASLEEELNSLKARKKIRDDLAIFYFNMLKIVATKAKLAREVKALRKDYSTQMESLVEYAHKNISFADSVELSFTEIGTTTSPTFGNAFNDEHMEFLRQVYATTEKVKKLMQVYSTLGMRR